MNCYGFIKWPGLSICIFSFSLSFSFCHCYADLPLRFFVVTLDFNVFPRVFPAEIGKGKTRRNEDVKILNVSGFSIEGSTEPSQRFLHTIVCIPTQLYMIRKIGCVANRIFIPLLVPSKQAYRTLCLSDG